MGSAAATGSPGAAAPAPTAATTEDGTVRIDRSEAGAAAAADLHANAFTTGNTIVLPSGHGPLDEGRGRSLLAHELVHVGQQRRLGSALPHESSPAGRALEQEARSAEQLAQVAAPSPRPSALPLARQGGGHAPAVAMPSLPGASTDVSQALQHALTLGAPASARSGEPMSAGPGTGVRPEDDLGAATPQRADASAPIGDTGAAPAPASPAPSLAGSLMEDPTELDELAHKLYERIRLRLGRELVLDRERAGLLTGSR
jgi:hypothetical protein